MNQSSSTSPLEARLRNAEMLKEGTYDKRTEHLSADGRGLFINRLILEDSPYLLQHAHNPVDWYPWGEEAFLAAKTQNKPVFLSIGYSTCHWCHVMEVESFDNIEVAEVLNKSFISIKMDREQYPDIDETYMTGVQLMSGHGGWPMSNFLLPDGKPFFGATYFPAPAFIKVLGQITSAWQDKYDELQTSADQISDAITKILNDSRSVAELDKHAVDNTLKALFQREDRSLGGLAGEPKFPQEPLLMFMLEQIRTERDLTSFGFVDRALEGMGRGGIYDQVGGGFHRYSVDERWLVPHFEKMLYNQSQLADIYLEAYQLSGNPFFERVCSQTLDYVLRDMQLPEGGFYSATDADSEGEEGLFFTWSISQLHDVLSQEEAALVIRLYGATEFGNFEGSNILCLTKPLEQHRVEVGDDSFYQTLDRILGKLYEARKRRVHPLRDDKLIVAWSSALATVLAKAGYKLGKMHWMDAARRAVDTMLKHNVDEQGQVQRIYLEGTTSIAGQLEDYANLVEALICLADVDSNPGYLEDACRIMKQTISEFWDDDKSAFYLSPCNQLGPQLTRSKNLSDGASLSPIGTALRCLQLLDKRRFLHTPIAELACGEKAHKALTTAAAHVNENPISHPSLLSLLAKEDGPDVRSLQTVDHGIATVKARKEMANGLGSLKVEINLSIAENWHVTAPAGFGESEAGFVALNLGISSHEKDWIIKSLHYPEAHETLDVPGADQLSIFSGSVTLCAELEPSAVPRDALSASVLMELTLQLCSTSECQLPVTLNMRV